MSDLSESSPEDTGILDLTRGIGRLAGGQVVVQSPLNQLLVCQGCQSSGIVVVHLHHTSLLTFVLILQKQSNPNRGASFCIRFAGTRVAEVSGTMESRQQVKITM